MCRCPCRSLGGGSLHALQPLVSHRARLSGRLSGLICRSTRFRAGRESGLAAGLVARVGAGRASRLVAGLVARVGAGRESGQVAGLVSAPWGELILNVRLV